MLKVLLEAGGDVGQKNYLNRRASDCLRATYEEVDQLLYKTVLIYLLDKDEWANNLFVCEQLLTQFQKIRLS